MQIEVYNKCSKNILVRVKDNGFILLKPNEKNIVIVENTDKVELSVRKEKASFLEKNMFYKRYILTIETRCGIKADEQALKLTIIGEKIRVTGDVYYERLCFCEKTNILYEYHSICDTDDICKIYNKRSFWYSLLVSPFEHLTFLCLIVLILTVVFIVKIGFLFSCFFFIMAYALIWMLDNGIKGLFNIFQRKIFNIESDTVEFKKVITDQYVNSFYQADYLQAYNNEIMKDEI